MIVKQTDLYSVDKSCTSINSNEDEIEKFLAIQTLVSVMKVPMYEMYQSQETHYKPISSTLYIK